jgi:DNA helicase-2/ATP-dependent DNA helicase PcrA
MKTNRLIIAGAGSGKTTKIIEEALKIKDGNILITTYTEANERAIRDKIIEINGCIPKNITIQTWFSFLIQHGIKPYQGFLFEHKVNGMLLVNERSGYFINRSGNRFYYSEEKDFDKYYFTSDYSVYSDKIAKLVFRCNEKSKNLVIKRLSKIYSPIFIEEVQDLAGYDLELLKLLFKSDSNILLVGDPRQVTYLTHNESKYGKYSNGSIKEFVNVECKKLKCEIDEKTLSHSYRNNSLICKYSSKLYPMYEETKSKESTKTNHDGIFLVKKSDINEYLKNYEPMQLRYNINSKDVINTCPVMNFGESKGLGFQRVLIYPATPMLDWVLDNSINLKDKTRAQFYVAITRAKFSVGIVCDDRINHPPNDVLLYSSNM